jgi:hypothetical protein
MSMPEITVKQLIAPVGTIVFIIGAFLAVEERYANQAELIKLQAQIDHHAAESEAGDKISELNSKVWFATKTWVDLVGREAMYQAKADAGIITTEERERWSTVRTMVRDARAELDRFSSELDALY